jgi:hypothetical protein
MMFQDAANFGYIEFAVEKPEVPPARGTAGEVYIEVMAVLGSCIVYATFDVQYDSQKLRHTWKVVLLLWSPGQSHMR